MKKKKKTKDQYSNEILQKLKQVFTRSSFVQRKYNECKIYKDVYNQNGELSKKKSVFFECNHCKKLFKRDEVQCDHINPVVPIQIPIKHCSWDVIIEERLFVPSSHLQLLCKDGCHKIKSQEENKQRREWKTKTKWIVYLTVNKLNGKRYLGVHKCIDLDDGYLGSGTALKRAIKKYGESSFYRKVLFVYDTMDEAYNKEKELVTLDIVNDDSYYNLKEGGTKGYKISEETRALLSKIRKGFTSPARIAARKNSGLKNVLTSLNLDNVDQLKIKAIHIETGNETHYDYIEDCAKKLKLSPSCISRVLRGCQNRTQHKGYIFKYLNRPNNQAKKKISPLIYISKNSKGGFNVTIKGKYIGYKKTLDDAIKLRDSYMSTCQKS